MVRVRNLVNNGSAVRHGSLMSVAVGRKKRAVRKVSAPHLSRLLSPVSAKTFMDTYLNRTPLYVQGRRHKFDFLFKAQDFKKHLERATEIRAVFPHLWQARIDPAD